MSDHAEDEATALANGLTPIQLARLALALSPIWLRDPISNEPASWPVAQLGHQMRGAYRYYFVRPMPDWLAEQFIPTEYHQLGWARERLVDAYMEKVERVGSVLSMAYLTRVEKTVRRVVNSNDVIQFAVGKAAWRRQEPLWSGMQKRMANRYGKLEYTSGPLKGQPREQWFDIMSVAMFRQTAEFPHPEQNGALAVEKFLHDALKTHPKYAANFSNAQGKLAGEVNTHYYCTYIAFLRRDEDEDEDEDYNPEEESESESESESGSAADESGEDESDDDQENESQESNASTAANSSQSD